VVARNGAGLSHRGDDGEARKLVGATGERHTLLKTENQNRQAALRAEITGSDECGALGITVTGSTPVLALCRLLVGAGHDPATPLEAWRGDVLCLRVRSIGEAAGLEINGHGSGFKRLRGGGAAPSIRWPTRGATGQPPGRAA
jgi:hypothetical protein